MKPMGDPGPIGLGTPYGPVALGDSVQMVGSPCLKVVQLSVTRYTAPVLVNHILKVVRVHATCRVITNGSAGL